MPCICRLDWNNFENFCIKTMFTVNSVLNRFESTSVIITRSELLLLDEFNCLLPKPQNVQTHELHVKKMSLFYLTQQHVYSVNKLVALNKYASSNSCDKLPCNGIRVGQCLPNRHMTITMVKHRNGQ